MVTFLLEDIQVLQQSYVVLLLGVILHPVTWKSDFGGNNGFGFEHQREWCLSSGLLRRRAVCPEHHWEFVDPCPHQSLKLLLEIVLYGFIRRFNLPVFLRISRGGEQLVDSKFLAHLIRIVSHYR